MQQVLQSLEAKKQRKLCSEVLSPIPASSPHLLPLTPKPSPFSPKLGLPISPRTPLPESPYKRSISRSYVSNKTVLPSQAIYLSVENSNNGSGLDQIGILSSTAHAMADVTVEFSGPNVVLKTISQQIPGQVLKIVAALESLSLEILHASISIVDGTLLNSFTIKVIILHFCPYLQELFITRTVKQNVKTSTNNKLRISAKYCPLSTSLWWILVENSISLLLEM